jgi:putative spermidine/putrescine transport system ATP-binding protein
MTTGRRFALELQRITKSYGWVEVLAPLDLTIGPGELVTLLGPSGSGKTTILGIAAGIVPADAGRVLSHGEDVTRQPPHRRNVGMVFQRYTLFPNKTVAENVAFPLRVRKLPAIEVRDRVSHFLALVGLLPLANRYPSQISGGEAQRVALARALVFGPALLLMDEPLGALDRRLRQNLQEEIRRIQHETKVPTLYVTHDQEEAMNLADRIVILRSGRVVAQGTPRQLYHDPVSLWAAEFLGDANACRAVSTEPHGTARCLATSDGGLRMTARLAPGARNGEDAFIVIRPEEVAVHCEPPVGGVHCRGEVIDVSFLGPVQQLRIRLDAGWLIRAVLPARRAIAPGMVVHCSWEQDIPIVVPRG